MRGVIRLGFALSVAVLATLLYAGPIKMGQGTFTHTIDTLTDTAQVIGFTPSSAVNAMVYLDSFSVGTDTCVATYTADANATIAEICAGLVANIISSCAGLFTAGDSTTYYSVQSLDAGVAWTIVSVDTTQSAAADTSLLQATTTGSSTDSATIPMFSMQYPEEYSALYGAITLQVANSEDDGYGKSLIATVVLNKYFNGTSTMVDSAYGTSLPLTLSPAWGKDTTGGGVDLDTMWGEYLEVRVTVADSMTESTTASYEHKVDWNLIPRK